MTPKVPTPRTDALAKDERHETYAETRYWCDQYKIFARQLETELAEATGLAQQIHSALKRGKQTDNHGLIGNLRCILDHVLSANDPEPLG